jgi:hypothetical protein
MATKPQYYKKYRRRRAELLEADPWCRYCGRPATVADHVPPVALHQHVDDDAGCCTLVPSCKKCSDIQGAGVKQVRQQLGVGSTGRAGVAADPVGFGPDDDVWADAGWVRKYADVPDDARWPTLMSAPHPDAVATLGALVAMCARGHGVELRWWQRLVADRLLEVDADGALCWREAIISTPRRTGKSVLIRELAWWRMVQGARLFGEEQTILHTSRTVGTTLDVARLAMKRARDVGYWVGSASGREEIRTPSGDRWLLKAEESAYGFGAGLAICDEAWDYNPQTVAEGIQPTMMERAQAQLLIVSTAHRRATKLVPERRASALAEMSEPRRRLLVEWSSPAGDDLLAACHAASPVWDKARRQYIEDAIDDARNSIAAPGDVDPVSMLISQYANDWSAGRQLGRSKGEPLVEQARWDAAADDVAGPPTVVAVEDFFGHSYAVGWAHTSPDSLDVVVGGRIVGDRQSLRYLLEQLAASTVLAGASICPDGVFDGLGAEPVGSRETRPALAELRRGVAEGRVFHDGSPDLGQQVGDVRVIGRDGGLAVLAGHRSDVMRAAAWCVAHIEASRRQSPAVF